MVIGTPIVIVLALITCSHLAASVGRDPDRPSVLEILSGECQLSSPFNPVSILTSTLTLDPKDPLSHFLTYPPYSALTNDIMADGETLNIPQLLAFMLISAIAIRYFFFSPSTARNATAAQSSNSSVQIAPGRRVDERHVTTLQAMFPQLDRRAILWDLMRNGGSVQATSERVLAGPGLDTVCLDLSGVVCI